MKRLFIICCLLGVTLAGKDKKINLEDIERDNLKSERKAKDPPTYNQSKPPVNIQYGFVPMKSTTENYPQQQKTQYTLPQQQQYIQQYSPQYSQQPQQFYTFQPEVTLQPQYVARAQQYVQQPHYQQYENVPYVTDNSIGQSYQHQYFTPQYVYIQPAASTSVQSVVDPKGGVQYVMYIPTPTYVKGQESAYQNLIPTQDYAYAPQQEYSPPQQDYSAPQAYDPASDPEYAKLVAAQTAKQAPVQYVSEPPAPKTISQYAQQENQTPTYPKEYTQLFAQLQAQKTGAVQYVTPESKKTEYVAPRQEPRSLLDSYVPSYLQLQYYKQQQQARAQEQENHLHYYTKQQEVQSQVQEEPQYYKQQLVEDNSVQQTKARPSSLKANKGAYRSNSRAYSNQPTYSVQVIKK